MTTVRRPDAEIETALRQLAEPNDSRPKWSGSREVHAIARGALRWPIERLEGVDVVDSDLRGSVIDRGWFRRTILRDCIFTATRLDPFDAERVDIVACRFGNVDFGSRGPSFLRHAGVTGSEFVQCDFRHVQFLACELTDVSLQDCRFLRTVVQGGRWERVRVTGHGGRLYFVNAELRNVDLAGLVPDDFALDGCQTVNVRLPNNRSSFVIRESSIAEGLAPAMAALTVEGRNLAKELLEGPSSPSFIGIGPEWLSLFGEPGDRAAVGDALYPFAVTEA